MKLKYQEVLKVNPEKLKLILQKIDDFKNEVDMKEIEQL